MINFGKIKVLKHHLLKYKMIIQDDYNKFITSKGFNLDRGQIRENKYHQTKAEKYLEDLHEENKLMELELNKNKALNKVKKSYKSNKNESFRSLQGGETRHKSSFSFV